MCRVGDEVVLQPLDTRRLVGSRLPWKNRRRLEGGKERDRVVGALNANALRSWVQSRLPSPAGKLPASIYKE